MLVYVPWVNADWRSVPKMSLDGNLCGLADVQRQDSEWVGLERPLPGVSFCARPSVDAIYVLATEKTPLRESGPALHEHHKSPHPDP
jgi:hypothetical protein